MKLTISRHAFAFVFYLVMFSLLTSENVICAQKNYYISPNLQLGIHSQASFDSPIRALISSGATIVVLKKKNKFTQIKTAKGTVGWVKSKFITQEEPLIKKVKKLELAIKKAQLTNSNSIKTVEQKASSDNEPIWQSQKQSYEETIAMLKEELKAWEQLDVQDKEAQKIHMQKDNQQLNERLARIAAIAIGNDLDRRVANIEDRTALDNIILSDKSFKKSSLLSVMNKNYLLLIIVSGVGFLLGIFIMDVINRRRHGGYRV